MYVISDAHLEQILLEDIPYGDLTATLLGIGSEHGQVLCYPKAAATVSAVSLARRLFVRAGLDVTQYVSDGESVAADTPLLCAKGAAQAIHAVYKTAQTLLEYCSGISTRTHTMVQLAQAVSPHCQVALTRKHFPGTKVLSLYAAQAGGGRIHRAGLSESVLVFDQHRVFMTDFSARLAQLHRLDPERKITVEVDTAEQGLEWARAGADIVQCERFDPARLAEFVAAVKRDCPSVLVSAAGGVNADNAAAYAAAGADFLVTTWPYFGRPMDMKMAISAV